METEVLERRISNLVRVLMKSPPFIMSEDVKGHDVVIGARVPKWFERWITEILEHGGTFYRIKSDVVRDALYLGLQILALRLGSEEWKVEEAIAKVISEVSLGAVVEKTVRDFSDNLRRLWEGDAKELAVGSLRGFIEALVELKDERRKTLYFKFLKQDYLIKQVALYGEIDLGGE